MKLEVDSLVSFIRHIRDDSSVWVRKIDLLENRFLLFFTAIGRHGEIVCYEQKEYTNACDEAIEKAREKLLNLHPSRVLNIGGGYSLR